MPKPDSPLSLDWLETLTPGYFALSMASGIISVAFRTAGQETLSELLYWMTLFSWIVLIVLSVWRLLRFPRAVKEDLLGPRRIFAFFTLVAATDIAGILFFQHGQTALSILCWACAFLAWSILLYLSFSVLTFLTTRHNVNAIHGDWLTSIVGTQSLVLLGALLAPQLGEYSGYMLMEIHILWGLGLVFYGIFLTLICQRLFFHDFKPADISPLLWIIMGAAAITSNAATSLAFSDTSQPFLITLRPFIGGMALLMWSWATWWIPMLMIFGLWKHGFHRHPLQYEPVNWSIVFPLGMYAVASFRLGAASGFALLPWVSRIALWASFAAWCLVLFGLLRRLAQVR